MGLTYIDQSGNRLPVIMGCYGIGVSRILPTVIEQNHDNKGIIWPSEIVPFDAVVIPIRYDKQAVRELTDKVYYDLLESGFDILLDDRDLTPGTKFKDSDLIGIPYKLIISEKAINGKNIEIEHRKDGRKEIVDLTKIVEEFAKRK